MKKLTSYIIGLLVLISCSNQQAKVEDISDTEVTNDSLKLQLLDSDLYSEIAEPFLVSDIAALQFTSGVGKEIENHKKCDSSGTGFYGSYSLIDRDFANESRGPVGGTITIHSNKRMSDWKSTDTDQIIWEIHLETDVIPVWDSISVGMTRSQIEAFGKANNGFCVKKGDNFYSCDFKNFSADYIFQNDTLKELTVTRKCGNESEIEN